MATAVNIYERDCSDFDNEGLGVVMCEDWNFVEAANGKSMVTLTIPAMDGVGLELVEYERIVMLDVPVRSVPEIEEGTVISTVEVWTVSTTATKEERALWSKQTDGSKKATLPKGLQVTIIDRGNDRLKVQTSKYGKGWVDINALDSHIEDIPYDVALDAMDAEVQVRAQQFRIRSIKYAGNCVEVEAWHRFYDLEGALVFFWAVGETSPCQWFEHLNNTPSCQPFRFYTDIGDTRAIVDWPDISPVKGLLDENTGVAHDFPGSGIIRDNTDVTMLRHPGRDRGLHIRYGRNLVAIRNYEQDFDIVTGIMPKGEYENGDPLYVEGQYIYADNAGDYAIPHNIVLPVSEAKVDTQKGVTEALARQRMREAVQAKWDEGINLPRITLEVEFARLGDTVEYQQFRQLEQCYLYDTVHVWHPRIGGEMEMQVSELTWNGPRRRYTKCVLGDPVRTIADLF